jgi:hypothetical protein
MAVIDWRFGMNKIKQIDKRLENVVNMLTTDISKTDELLRELITTVRADKVKKYAERQGLIND